MVILYYMIVGLFIFMLVGNALLMFQVYKTYREIRVFETGVLTILAMMAKDLSDLRENGGDNLK